MLSKTAMLSLALLLFTALGAQEKYTLSGYITDAETSEPLIGAVIVEPNTNKGTTANLYGFYSLTLTSGPVDIVYSYVGYTAQKQTLELTQDMSINMALSPSVELGTAEIVATEDQVDRTQMSTVRLDMKKVDQLPVLLGEKDILKTIQLLPGVQSGSEGTSGIYVRGGGPDQNLLLLDGVPIYNASHLFGFFSVFNSDAIRNVELVKGGFPARYGGRLSSVLDMRMKEGNMREFHGQGSIGVVASRLTLEGPIKKDKSSFLVSARRTYIDILAQPFIRAQADGGRGGYYFYDLNAKLNYKLSDKDRFYLSGYFGRDKAYFREENSGFNNQQIDSELSWGNAIVAGRWNHLFGSRLFSNTTLTYSKYDFLTAFFIESDDEKSSLEYISGIQDFGAKIDFDFMPDPKHYVRFGGSYTFHTFTPGVNEIDIQEQGFEQQLSFGSGKIQAHESFVYVEDEWQIGEKFKINPGLHLSHFNVEGKNYAALQPRFSGRYLINELSSIKASYANMQQYLHLLSNGGVGLPTDLWVPVTSKILPQTSDQIALGAVRRLGKQYELSVEGYYKWMRNLIEYKDGAGFQGTADDWQTKVATGDGTAYGAEVLLSKVEGKFSGWIGYTLSWSNREFEELNFGEPFPYRFDRRHDIGVALSYQISDRVDVGLVWVYGTGNAFSLPVARYPGASSLPSINSDNQQFFFGQGEVEHIPSRNNYRMPAYHRLDLGFNFHKQLKRHERIWNIGVYNIYNRQNPFYLFFSTETTFAPDGTFSSQRQLKQASLFPLIPGFAYTFKF